MSSNQHFYLGKLTKYLYFVTLQLCKNLKQNKKELCKTF